MKKEIIVLGAGISGLSLCWFLKKRYGNSISIRIVDKSHRVGGCIQTLKQGDFLFEQGPRSCRPQGQGLETLKLIEELQLENEVITADHFSKKRYIYQNNQLVPLPSGILNLLSSRYAIKIAKSLWQDCFAPKGISNDESVADFISRRLGPTIAEELIDPLMSGIYAGDITELSICSCLPDLFTWEKLHGSIIKGILFRLFRKKQQKATHTAFIQEILKHPIFTFKSGMETLPLTLAKHLDVDFHFEAEVTDLAIQRGKAMIYLADGRIYAADHVFSTLPPAVLCQLIKACSPASAAILQSIPSASLAVVNLGYKHKVLNIKGFGYLIPSKEKTSILGNVWDSSIFPQQQNPNATCLTVMLGGRHNPHIGNLSENDLINKSLNAIAKHLNITSIPDAIHVNFAQQAIPQPLVGHEEKLNQLKTILSQHIPCLTLHGNYFGVSVNACIAYSKNIVDKGLPLA